MRKDYAGQERGNGCCKAAGHAVTVQAEDEVEHSDVTDEAEDLKVQQLVECDELAYEDYKPIENGFDAAVDEGECVHDSF